MIYRSNIIFFYKHPILLFNNNNKDWTLKNKLFSRIKYPKQFIDKYLLKLF